MIDGLPFAPWYTGDDFLNTSIPFHVPESHFPNGLPTPAEEVDVAIIGGGISGLACALLLRRFNPVLLEMRKKFGGNAQGEYWAGTHYSLGSAYVITPDPGSFLHRFYHQLGLHQVVRVDTGENPVELMGQFVDGFWGGAGQPPQDVLAFERYAEIVRYYAEDSYPEIPLPVGENNQWIIDLDRKSLHEDIIEKMNGLPLPPLLAGAIQGYCYSSFGVGWDEISAAGGWNFIAAEEYGRWVFPGGNAYMADAMWKKLVALEGNGNCPPRHLRGGCKVVDVRVVPGDRVQVTYADSENVFRSLLARRVIMANSKHIVKYMLHELNTLDNPKYEAMQRIDTMAYLVANVLLNEPLRLDFYDAFLLRDGNFPMTDYQVELNPQFVDVVNGQYARPQDLPRTVLTVYWPLPWHTARFSLVVEEGWNNYAKRFVPDLKDALNLFGLSPASVRQIRMTRWAHAMPVNRQYLIADGVTDHLRRPFEGLVYFVNQDNWALPAVENSLLDAEFFCDQIASELS